MIPWKATPKTQPEDNAELDGANDSAITSPADGRTEIPYTVPTTGALKHRSNHWGAVFPKEGVMLHPTAHMSG